MEIRSKSLSRNLKGCRQVVLFGATLGAGVDRLMRRISLTDMARAVILQSCAAAMLEEYCDECQKKIATELEEEHLYLRPRFSPGYGDFDICYQEIEKNLGKMYDPVIGRFVLDNWDKVITVLQKDENSPEVLIQ